MCQISFGDLPIAVITSVCTCNSLSHTLITLFLTYQDVINDQIWISLIPRPTEFHHGLDLNHTTLIQSQVIGFWPLTIQFLATVIDQKSVLPCFCQFVVLSFSRASYENAYSPEWIVLVNSIRLNGTPRGGDLYAFTNPKSWNLYWTISQRIMLQPSGMLVCSWNINIDVYYEYVRVCI